jgi:hypothetical protein
VDEMPSSFTERMNKVRNGDPRYEGTPPGLFLALEVVAEEAESVEIAEVVDLVAFETTNLHALQEDVRTRILRAHGRTFTRAEQIIAECGRLNALAHDLLGYWMDENQAEFHMIDGRRIAKGVMIDVLYNIGLGARACTSALEVLSLCRSGYMNGARSSCRTLYETLVTVKFLSLDSSVALNLADRLHLSATVFHHKYLIRQQADYQARGITIDLNTEIATHERQRDEILQIYPGLGRGSYEWARPAFPDLSKGRRVTFEMLEASVAMDVSRSHYVDWSNSIHPTPGSIISEARFDRNLAYEYGPELRRFYHEVWNAVGMLALVTEVVHYRLCAYGDAMDEMDELQSLIKLNNGFHQLIVDEYLEVPAESWGRYSGAD